MRDQPRCPSCQRTLLPFTDRLWCVACRREYPMPPVGTVVLTSPVVYEQQAQARMVKEGVYAASE